MPYVWQLRRMVSEIIGRGCPDRVIGPDGLTALLAAVRYCDEQSAAMLLAHGATVDKPNVYGQTALEFAIQESGLEKLVKLLIDHGASFRSHDFGPLLRAFEKGANATLQHLRVCDITEFFCERINFNLLQSVAQYRKDSDSVDGSEYQNWGGLLARLAILDDLGFEDLSSVQYDLTEAYDSAMLRIHTRRASLIEKEMLSQRCKAAFAVQEELAEWSSELTKREMLLAQREQCVDNTICAVCYSERPSVLFLPCRHMKLCKTCSGNVSSCPICRQYIRERIGLFV